MGDKANGGYLLALLGRAARVTARRHGGRDWEVLSSSVTYLRAPASGQRLCGRRCCAAAGRPATYGPSWPRAGTTWSTRCSSWATFCAETAVRYDGTEPFHAPDPEECVRLTPKIPTGVHVGILDVLDLRLDPATLPFAMTPPPAPTKAELRGWTRFADGRHPDALSLLFLADAIPPATLMIGSTGWVPTLQMSAYVRARPAPGWLAIRMTAGLVADGMVDETCHLWDSGGRMVGQSTQLARLRFPDDST